MLSGRVQKDGRGVLVTDQSRRHNIACQNKMSHMQKEDRGVLVTDVAQTGSAVDVLQKNDILMHSTCMPKQHHRVQKEDRGVLVTDVAQTGSAVDVLQKNDVLMHFDGHAVSCDGTTPFRTGERIMFTHLVSQRFVGDTVSVTVRRGGKKLELSMTLKMPTQLVPPHLASKVRAVRRPPITCASRRLPSPVPLDASVWGLSCSVCP